MAISKIVFMGEGLDNLVKLLEDMRNYLELHNDSDVEKELLHKIFIVTQDARAGSKYSLKV